MISQGTGNFANNEFSSEGFNGYKWRYLFPGTGGVVPGCRPGTLYPTKVFSHFYIQETQFKQNVTYLVEEMLCFCPKWFCLSKQPHFNSDFQLNSKG